MSETKNTWKDKLYETDNPLIEVEELDLDYQTAKGCVNALSHINFSIHRGEFITVLGPSGCGKSTLLKILAGFIKPTKGIAKLEGKQIKGTDWSRGVVFQNPPLYEWFSVRQNIAFGPKMRKIAKEEYEPKVEEYLQKVGLTEFGEKKIYELSGGMKQRVSIAKRNHAVLWWIWMCEFFRCSAFQNS